MLTIFWKWGFSPPPSTSMLRIFCDKSFDNITAELDAEFFFPFLFFLLIFPKFHSLKKKEKKSKAKIFFSLFKILDYIKTGISNRYIELLMLENVCLVCGKIFYFSIEMVWKCCEFLNTCLLFSEINRNFVLFLSCYCCIVQWMY